MSARPRVPTISTAGDADLFAVVTVPEAAAIVGRHPVTIRHAINRGRLNARQVERGVWLISVASLKETYL